MAKKLPLYNKVKGDIVAHATIDNQHFERANKYNWVCRKTKKGYTSVYAYVNKKTVTLTIFLFGKPEKGNYIRRDKSGFDYTKDNVLQFTDSVTEQMEDLVSEIHSEDILIPVGGEAIDETCGRLQLGHWCVLFDNEYSSTIKKYSWNVSIRHTNDHLYCYVVRSVYTDKKNNPVTVNLSRVLLDIQDIETGETFPGMEKMVAVYKRQPTIEEKIIDLRLSNLMRVSRSMMSYRRRAFSNKKNSPFVGVVKTGNEKWTAAIKGSKNKRPVYLGTYETAKEAAQARDRFVIEQGLHYVIRLNFPVENYRELLDEKGRNHNDTRTREVGRVE